MARWCHIGIQQNLKANGYCIAVERDTLFPCYHGAQWVVMVEVGFLMCVCVGALSAYSGPGKLLILLLPQDVLGALGSPNKLFYKAEDKVGHLVIWP